MYSNEEEDKIVYKIVINHEKQYSIWFANRENPFGWNDVGKSGLKAECLAYIREVFLHGSRYRESWERNIRFLGKSSTTTCPSDY